MTVVDVKTRFERSVVKLVTCDSVIFELSPAAVPEVFAAFAGMSPLNSVGSNEWDKVAERLAAVPLVF